MSDQPSSNTSPQASENPIGDQFNVVVSVPHSVQIRMVNASALGDYEIWVFIASLLSNAVVGFLVAYLQASDVKAPSTSSLGWSLLIFVVLFLLSLAMAIGKRNSLSKKGRDIKLRTSGVSLDSDTATRSIQAETAI